MSDAVKLAFRPLTVAPKGVLVLFTDEGLTAVYGAAGPRAWIVRPDGHLASSLSLTDAAPGSVFARLAEMVGRAAGRGRGSVPG